MHAIQVAVTDVGDHLADLASNVPGLVAATLVLLIFIGVARLVDRLIFNVGRVSRIDSALRDLIERLITVGIIVFGLAIALNVVGLNAGTIVASFGVAGLIVGFALKDILENFIAGIMILWRRPFKLTDEIKIGLQEGTVREITFRTTTLRTPDGVEVLIPNAQFLTQAVYNFTHLGSRRTTIVLKLPLTGDVEQARTMLRQIPLGIAGVYPTPAPEVLLLGISDDSYELHLRYWTRPDVNSAQAIESAVRLAAHDALREACYVNRDA